MCILNARELSLIKEEQGQHSLLQVFHHPSIWCSMLPGVSNCLDGIRPACKRPLLMVLTLGQWQKMAVAGVNFCH
jgi:hypothetical protein